MYVNKHWRIQGGATSAHPPKGSNSFIFAYVFTEKHCIGGWRPPPSMARCPLPPTGNPGSATDKTCVLQRTAKRAQNISLGIYQCMLFKDCSVS